ncbi:MAG: helix-turn-helix domain-containing protein [Nocardiaceae bacterium]|nr:helix-turn-helix domain-containing protein [Nocardiaceae bacterium]
MAKPTKTSYSFEFKLAVVREFLAGESSAVEIARVHGLSSKDLVKSWVQTYRREGEEGLKPKPKGRPAAESGPPRELSELEQLQRENLRLRAENAYLKKLKALREQGRR